MKKVFFAVIFSLAAYFLTQGSLLGSEASPTKPVSKSQRQMLFEKSGTVDSDMMSSPALATVLPNPEYKRLPAFDFIPKRLRVE